MKVAIAINQKAINQKAFLENEIAPHFGRAKYFLIYDTGAKKFLILPNPEATGQMPLPPDLLAKHKVDVVITFSLGLSAYQKFKDYNIKMYRATKETVAENFQKLAENKLAKLTKKDIF